MTRLLTARDVADLLGVSAETILRWTRAGKLPAVRLPGGAIRFREDELEGWLTACGAAAGRGVGEHPAGHHPGSSAHSITSRTPEDEE